VVLNLIYEWFEVVRISDCPNPQCNVAKGEVLIHPGRDQDIPELLTPTSIFFFLNKGREQQCDGSSEKDGKCKEIVRIMFKFGLNGAPPFIGFNLPCNQQLNNIKEDDLPTKQVVLGTPYRLYAYTKLSGKHFTLVLISSNKLYLFDGLSGGSLSQYKKNNIGSISSIFLVRDDINF